MVNETFYFENDKFFHPVLQLDDKDLEKKVTNILDDYRLSIEKLNDLKSLFNYEIQAWLKPELALRSDFPMINTFVTKYPTGKERGNFLGLDIGGTNLRVIHLTLTDGVDGKTATEMNVELYDVPAEYRLGTTETFFNFLASCVQKYMIVHFPNQSLENRVPLGFTFSFGFHQLAIDKGCIFQMGIATNLIDAVDKDPVSIFQKSLDSLNVPVKIVALANDSTTTLVYGKHLVPETTISVILGSGSNVAYVEKVSNCPTIKDPVETFGSDVKEVIINSECVLYGDNGKMDHLKTRYDFELDANSLVPSSYTYEKIVGGAYLGELYRYTLVDLVRNNLLLKGKFTKEIVTSKSIETKDMSLIDGEIVENGCSKHVRHLLNRLGYSDQQYTSVDCKIMEYLCQLITVRGAQFCAVSLAAFVDHIEPTVVKIACDGSVFKKHPKIPRLINGFLNKLCPKKQSEVFLADFGSSIGAAIVASCYA